MGTQSSLWKLVQLLLFINSFSHHQANEETMDKFRALSSSLREYLRHRHDNLSDEEKEIRDEQDVPAIKTYESLLQLWASYDVPQEYVHDALITSDAFVRFEMEDIEYAIDGPTIQYLQKVQEKYTDMFLREYSLNETTKMLNGYLTIYLRNMYIMSDMVLSEQEVRQAQRLVPRIALQMKLYQEDNEVHIAKLILSMSNFHVASNAVADLVRTQLCTDSNYSLVGKLNGNQVFGTFLLGLLEVAPELCSEMIESDNRAGLEGYLTSMSFTIAKIHPNLLNSRGIRLSDIEKFVVYLADKSRTIEEMGAGQALADLRLILITLHTRFTSVDLFHQLDVVNAILNGTTLMIQNNKEEPSNGVVMVQHMANARSLFLSSVSNCIAAQEMIRKNSDVPFEIHPQILRQIIVWDLELLQSKIPSWVNAFYESETEHDHVLKIAYEQLRANLAYSRPPMVLVDLNMAKITQRIRKSILKDPQDTMNTLFAYAMHSKYAGFETSLTLPPESKEKVIQMMISKFSKTRTRIIVNSNFEHWFSKDFLGGMKPEDSPAMRKLIPEATRAKESFLNKLGLDSDCMTIFKAFSSVSFGVRTAAAAFVSDSPQDMLKIAQIDAALNQCKDLFAGPVRKSFAGIRDDIANWLLREAESNDEAKRTLIAHANFLPADFQSPHLTVFDKQAAFVHHCKMWFPKAPTIHSVENLKRFVSLDAAIDWNSMSPNEVHKNLDMDYHQCMASVLQQLATQTDQTQFGKILENKDLFTSINNFESQLGGIFDGVAELSKIKMDMETVKIQIDTQKLYTKKVNAREEKLQTERDKLSDKEYARSFKRIQNDRNFMENEKKDIERKRIRVAMARPKILLKTLTDRFRFSLHYIGLVVLRFTRHQQMAARMGKHLGILLEKSQRLKEVHDAIRHIAGTLGWQNRLLIDVSKNLDELLSSIQI